MEKINDYLPTPLLLQCFCNQCIKLKDEEKLHVYKLFSVITHVGVSMLTGHYLAYTSSLSIHENQSFEYANCSSDKRKNDVAVNNEKNPGLVKKLIYGRNKASSKLFILLCAIIH